MESVAENIMGIIAVVAIFIGMPWIILHYITQWKRAGGITREDENLLDELHETARRLDERLCSIERIMTADNPDWKAVDCAPPTPRLETARRERPSLEKRH